MASRTMVLVIAAAIGCGSTTDVTLELVDGNGDCAPAFGKIRTLSIEALANNGRCRLAHRCVFGVTGAASIDDLDAALHASTDVLLEVDPDDAQVLRINGRPLNDCFPSAGNNDPVVCGNANLDAGAGGTLVIELEASGCIESLELCP